jgi:3-oxoacyl-[acyl-carrier-protein] synthase-3
MNGGEVFNFAVRTVPPLMEELFEYGSFSKDETDYFVLHQANKYILKNIARKLGVTEDRLPMETATIYGNQNSASIPGTINAFLSEQYSQKRLRSVFSGFGIGLSWGACSVITDQVYAPHVETYHRRA